MRLVAPRAELVRTLGYCADVVDRRAPNNVASCVRIDVGRDVATVFGTDTVMSAQAQLTTMAGAAGAFGFPAKDLLERVRAMPDGDVEIVVKDATAIIKQGKRKYTLRTVPANDFPGLPTMPEGAVQAELPASTLAALLRGTAYAMNSEPNGRVHGVHLDLTPQYARADATDGRVMAMVVCASAPVESGKVSALIPYKAAGALLALAEALGDKPITLLVTGPMMRALGGGALLAFPLLAEAFPNVDAFLRPPATGIVTAREPLVEVVKAISIASSRQHAAVDLEAKDGALHVSAADAEGGGDATDQVPAECSVPAKARLAHRRLLEALVAIQTDQVEIGIGGALDPVLVRPRPDPSAARHVLMPIVQGATT